MLTRKYIIHGRVQGVGYRYFAQRCARDRGVVGYAKNLWDGDVEVAAQGDQVALDLFASDLRQGPSVSRVERVVEDDVDMPPFAGFGIEFY